MIGAIIGDIVGSIYEFDNIRHKEFQFFQPKMEFTDDSILSIATASWLLRLAQQAENTDAADIYMHYTLQYQHPKGGYGHGFWNWASNYSQGGSKQAYGSCGNGSAMRVGPIAWACSTEEEVMAMAEKSAVCTHNHPGGIAGAQATALCVLWARQGKSKEFIRQTITERFGYNLTTSIERLQKVYSWEGMPGEEWTGATCQGSVPQAIICALDAIDFEDSIRNAISIGGDSDTIACITGSIAEALYGIPREMYNQAIAYLNSAPKLRSKLEEFESKFGNNVLS